MTGPESLAIAGEEERHGNGRTDTRLFEYGVAVRRTSEWQSAKQEFETPALVTRLTSMTKMAGKERETEQLRVQELTFSVEMLMAAQNLLFAKTNIRRR